MYSSSDGDDWGRLARMDRANSRHFENGFEGLYFASEAKGKQLYGSVIKDSG